MCFFLITDATLGQCQVEEALSNRAAKVVSVKAGKT